MVTLALIVMVLIQRSDSDGFGLGGGSGNNFLTGRASANLMTRTTAILAGIFMLNALVLSVLAVHQKPSGILETIEQQQSTAPEAPGANPAMPASAATPAAKTDDKPAAAAPAEKTAPAIPNVGEDAPKPKPVVKKKAAAPVVPVPDAAGEAEKE